MKPSKDIIEFNATLPELEPYEGKATQKQKQKIWELGYKDKDVIDKLGKKQASILIDELISFYKLHQAKEGGKYSGIVVMSFSILALIGGIACAIFVEDTEYRNYLLIGGGVFLVGGFIEYQRNK